MAIGKNGKLPWRLPSDLARFKQKTVGGACIMGRRTWESLPKKPLAERTNIVVSRTLRCLEGAEVCASLEAALLAAGERADEVFVIGGAELYAEALAHPQCGRVLVTAVEGRFEDCDTFFPSLRASDFRLASRCPWREENGIKFRYEIYERIFEHQEYQYLGLVRRIIEEGTRRADRTGVGTVSLFGESMRFSLRDKSFPLLTTKRVFWRGVAEELLWFLRGSTDAQELAEKNVHIWDDNGSEQFLRDRGLDYRRGDLGPVYGFQWRHFGASYEGCDKNYENQGIDQLKAVIDAINNDPTSRRILMTAWNPADLDKMALPPCHVFCQFYVAEGKLSCQLYQRSADMGLGVPFNIASYALLVRLVAHVTRLKPGDLVHVVGDAHVYLNHIEPLKTQLARTPRDFPTLEINPDITDISDFSFQDFTLSGYNPRAKISMDMAV
ncbi:hypothetical protein CTAYLR_003529 [Chrysophaeum taylorii]|uniref:Bifunctional dihydrofolate reductase-thymidylate synthase n=1 Tax=Chrysophaeum taylorii TaxID=2483200 RepID=A0AAD7UCB8_9STRA|nr:hypothetical protein CTAYLR_003529 [Chrysophaeum taylorii]